MRNTKNKLTIHMAGKSTTPYDDTEIWAEVNKKLDSEDISDWALEDEKPTYTYEEIEEKPVTYPPTTHTHIMTDITDYVKPVYSYREIENKPKTWNDIVGEEG